MDWSQTSHLNSPSNCSTFSERENNAENSLNFNLARQRFIDTFTVKVERDVSESSQEQMRNDETNLQDIKLEPQFCIADENDLMEENHRAAGCDVRIKTEADESCSNLHHVPFASIYIENLQDEDQLQNEFTSELIIKSEHEWSDVEESRDNNADSEDLISEATENKTSAADFKEKRKKIAKNVKFCAHCEFTTHSKRTLRNHIQAHEKSECEIGRQVDTGHLKCAVSQVSSRTCQICGNVFKRKANVTRHLKLHEYKYKGIYECQVCKKKFDTSVEFKLHKKNHVNKNIHQCLECDKVFKRRNVLNQHIQYEHEGIRPIICTQCSKSFKTKFDLKDHLAVHTDVRAFKCDKCSKSFKTKKVLQKHNRTVHSEVKLFMCEKCGKAFKSRQILLHHDYVHSQELNFKCEKCDKKFKSQNHLYLHKKVHVSLRKFHCTLCPQKFKTKAHLSRHAMTVHSDVRPFSCYICAKTYKTKSDLKKHGVVHSNAYCDVKCNLCDAIFKCKRSLNRHVKFVHSDARPFKCNECEKSYKTKPELKRHIAGHLNLRQFKCDKCDWSFNCKIDLKKHGAVHSDIFPFKCNICERKFKLKQLLKRHIFRRHMK